MANCTWTFLQKAFVICVLIISRHFPNFQLPSVRNFVCKETTIWQGFELLLQRSITTGIAKSWSVEDESWKASVCMRVFATLMTTKAAWELRSESLRESFRNSNLMAWSDKNKTLNYRSWEARVCMRGFSCLVKRGWELQYLELKLKFTYRYAYLNPD